jgi:hypothetical protein
MLSGTDEAGNYTGRKDPGSLGTGQVMRIRWQIYIPGTVRVPDIMRKGGAGDTFTGTKILRAG